MYCIVVELLQHPVPQPSPVFVPPQIPEPNDDKNVKDQDDSPLLSSSGPLATMAKTSP